MRQYFTADTHFNHEAIIKYCNRPFKDRFQMNEVLVDRINSRVKSDDLLYFLGDWCYKNKDENWKFWKDTINANIIFVQGNHDIPNKVKTDIVQILLRKSGISINLIHDPIYANPYYELNLCGHVHEKFRFIDFESYYQRLSENIVDDKRWVSKRDWFVNKWKTADKTKTFIINVGVDVNNFYPFSFDEIMSIYSVWKNGREK